MYILQQKKGRPTHERPDTMKAKKSQLIIFLADSGHSASNVSR